MGKDTCMPQQCEVGLSHPGRRRRAWQNIGGLRARSGLHRPPVLFAACLIAQTSLRVLALGKAKVFRPLPAVVFQCLPVAGVAHAEPWFGRGQGAALLQKLDRDIVGAAHKGHAAIAGRAVDGDAIGLKMGAGGIDIVHLIGQMAEVSAVRGQACVAVPVEGQLDRAVGLAGRSHEDQSEAACFTVHPAGLFQPQQPVEGLRGVKVQHPDHGVQISDCHCVFPFSGARTIRRKGWAMQLQKELDTPNVTPKSEVSRTTTSENVRAAEIVTVGLKPKVSSASNFDVVEIFTFRSGAKLGVIQ